MLKSKHSNLYIKMKLHLTFFGFALGTLLFLRCDIGNSPKVKLFSNLASSETNITFTNILKENDSLNYFTYSSMYMGGGVATGDFNNDSLIDIFFTGNMVTNKLYLNKGNWIFEDITRNAKIGGDKRWYTGVTIVDINADGWLDIYLSVSGKGGNLKNQLYINNGDLSFSESASQYGIDDSGSSIQSVFFDYDKDGDLDLYIANYPIAPTDSSNSYYKRKMMRPLESETDHLYRNNGNGSFTRVSKEAGVANYGLSLGVSVGDYNNDGWDDIYISNDFSTPDRFFINNHNGTFSEVLKESTQQTSYYAMGSDVADFNNDGLLDFIQVDMTPEDNRRAKSNMASMSNHSFWNTINSGFHYQYMHNVLQLNRGITRKGLPHFSNISKLAKVSLTDWSWAPLFVDLDNDGWKDIFISNGIKRDINNKDFFENLRNEFALGNKTNVNVESIPSEPIENNVFRNNTDLTFEEVGKTWGLNHKGFSNGVAYADLDNDGDLDLVVNNLDEIASVYRNNAEKTKNHFMRFILKGSKQNPNGIGTKVQVFNDEEQQLQQLTLTRGFQSAVEPIIHFGLGFNDRIDSIIVSWPDGKQQRLFDLKADQIIKIYYENANSKKYHLAHEDKLFNEVSPSKISFKHEENIYDDYSLEPLLPYATSKLGPKLAVGDLNGDGMDDFFIGNASKSTAGLFIQGQNQTFDKQEGPWSLDALNEDMGTLFFDADADGDLDLYVVSGGNEFVDHPNLLQDRLYLNNGNAQFQKLKDAIPDMPTSGSVAKAADFDKDGDLDLFIGGRLVPGKYPLPAKSYILLNESEKAGKIKFVDVTNKIAPEFQSLGLITDAIWSDFNNDGNPDLVITGEWMPLLFFENDNGVFKSRTQDFGLEKHTGWWSTIVHGDFDKDGDLDYIAGNLGTNYKYQASMKEPFEVYSSDFDQNGKQDIVLSYYQNQVQYPLRGRECSSQQIPAINYKFKDYNSFAAASLSDVYGSLSLKRALNYKATTFSTSYIENRGENKWDITPLPVETQLSSVNKIISTDVNNDGNIDLILGGNLFSSEVETPRNDASVGLYLEGKGDGTFNSLPPVKTGLYLSGDVKDMVRLSTKDKSKKMILVAKNNDSLQLVKYSLKTLNR